MVETEGRKIIIKGKEVKFSSKPVMVNNQLFAPAKDMLDAWGIGYKWRPEDKSLQIKSRSKKIEFVVGKLQVKVDEKEQELTTAPIIFEDYLYLPVNKLFELLDAFILEDSEKNEVIINPKVIKIEKEEQIKGLRIKILGSDKLEYSVKKLINPPRIVIDLLNTYLEVGTQTQPLEYGVIKEVRCAQFQVKPTMISRVVIELNLPLNFNVLSSEDETEIYVDFSHQITEILWEKSEEKIKIHVISTGEITYKTMELVQPPRLAVDFLNSVIAVKRRELLVQEDKLIRIRSAQFKVNPDIVRVVLDLDKLCAYKIEISPDKKRLTMEIYKFIPSFLKRVIIIDPGHGGKDPGARSSMGIIEKDINLEIGLYLKELLLNAGASVLLTREKDVFISLDERVQMAENKKADLYVSIHANALPRDKNIRGTETYYWTPQSKGFAKVVQENLVKEIGLPDRGVKTARFVVIKNTTMPAILVEVGYLTNSEDENLLKDTSFRKKVAEGIFKGIKNYLEERPYKIKEKETETILPKEETIKNY